MTPLTWQVAPTLYCDWHSPLQLAHSTVMALGSLTTVLECVWQYEKCAKKPPTGIITELKRGDCSHMRITYSMEIVSEINFYVWMGASV